MAWRQFILAILRPLLAAGIMDLYAQPAVAQESREGVEASGSDITRPTHRLDLRTELESAEAERTTKVTLRYDHPLQLSNRWRLNLRVDMPFASVRPREEDAESHGNQSGAGDILLHAVFAHYVHENEGLGFGTELIIPTASDEALGKGKWRLRPMGGYRWSLPRLSDESFFQILVRYDFSFAGDHNRSDVRDLQFAPNLEIALPHSAYVSFFPSADIRYNFVRNEFFAPINVEVGKSFGRVVVSLEVAKGVIHEEHPPYNWRAEGRIGLRF